MNLDNAIGLLADLELYGTTSQTTVTGLRTAVNNFAKDGLDAETALRDVINEIANMEDASEATGGRNFRQQGRAGVCRGDQKRSYFRR